VGNHTRTEKLLHNTDLYRTVQLCLTSQAHSQGIRKRQPLAVHTNNVSGFVQNQVTGMADACDSPPLLPIAQAVTLHPCSSKLNLEKEKRGVGDLR